MLSAHDAQRRELVPRSDPAPEGWIHAVAPDPREQELLAGHGIPEHFIQHALDVDEQARVEHDPGGATLVVLRVPGREGRGGRTSTLAVMWCDKLLLTISSHPLELVTSLARRLDAAPHPFAMLFDLVHAASAEFLIRLDQIDETVERLEQKLKNSLRNEEVLGLLECQKALVHLERALVSDQIMLEHLREDSAVPLEPDARRRLEEALVELRQAIQSTTISTEILASMMDAFASIISNNLSNIMKLMAALTVMLAIPTMIAGLWGMNVSLPGERTSWAFAALVGSVLVLSLLVGVVFRRLKWL